MIEELSQGQFVKKHLNSDCQLDMSKLIVAGHSFGGTTAITTALRDKRVKGILIQDPNLINAMKGANIEKDFNLGDTAVHTIFTEYFEDFMEQAGLNFDPFHNRDEFIRINSRGDHKEWITFKGHGHAHPTDFTLLAPDMIHIVSNFNRMPWSGRELGIQLQMYALSHIKFLKKNGLAYEDIDMKAIDEVYDPRAHLLVKDGPLKNKFV